MTYNDEEHKAFQKLGKEMDWDMSLHPMFLIYLDNKTAERLIVFKRGYAARKEEIKQLQYELGQTKISLDYRTKHLSQAEQALEERDAQSAL